MADWLSAPDVFWFDHDGDIAAQSVELSERLGIPVDLVTGWTPNRNASMQLKPKG
jgi:hypothetical protein